MCLFQCVFFLSRSFVTSPQKVNFGKELSSCFGSFQVKHFALAKTFVGSTSFQEAQYATPRRAGQGTNVALLQPADAHSLKVHEGNDKTRTFF